MAGSETPLSPNQSGRRTFWQSAGHDGEGARTCGRAPVAARRQCPAPSSRTFHRASAAKLTGNGLLMDTKTTRALCRGVWFDTFNTIKKFHGSLKQTG